MATGYKVIIKGKHHFGNRENTFQQYERDVSFKGARNTYEIDLPDIDTSQPAVLSFRTFEVDWRNNVFTLNGESIIDALTPKSQDHTWSTHQLIIPEGLLVQGSNRLIIEARNRQGGVTGNLEDFIIADVILMFTKVEAQVEVDEVDEVDVEAEP